MGLSSNARLLSITARLTSNEYESQQLSNAKMRLATRSQEVSENYIAALNTTNYSFLTFDAAGNSYNSTLTPALLYQYGDNKNQYILTNAAGKALISSEDAKNFENSNSLQDFLKCYGLNAEYKTETLQKSYEAIKNEIDTDGGCKTWNAVLFELKEEIKKNPELAKYRESAWSKKKNQTYSTTDGGEIYGGPQGLYQNALNKYNNLVLSANNDIEIDVNDLNFAREQVSALRQDAVDIITYDSWLEAQVRKAVNTKDASEDRLKNFQDTAKASAETLLNHFKPLTENGTPEIALGDLSQMTQDFFNSIQQMSNVIGKDDGSVFIATDYFTFIYDDDTAISSYSWIFSNPYYYDKQLPNSNNVDTKQLINDLEAFITNFNKYYEEKISLNNEKNKDILLNSLGTDTVANAYGKLQDYCKELSNYNAELERLGISSEEAFTYDDRDKAQWYTNLWYKLNGSSTVKNCNTNANYDVLESGIISSTSWITNAIMQGQVSIEVASALNCEKTAMDDENPFIFNLSGINWTTKIFSNCTDIVENDNDKAVAAAEGEYQRAMAEINAKDEKYQRQISLLDSQHNALQTEYDSVKSAMDKNIDRSFKAFQG